MATSDNAPPDPLSKTQRKNEMLALQKLGESLITLPDGQLAKLALPADLLDAIHVARTLKTHESIRRHLQYIGKKMRAIDPERIKIALKQVQFTNEQRTDAFHHLEALREQLISGGDHALNAFLASHPEADRQQLRQIIRKAVHDRANEKKTGGELALFRYLRDICGSA